MTRTSYRLSIERAQIWTVEVGGAGFPHSLATCALVQVLRSEYACFGVEACDAHDQTVVRVAELYGSGIRLNIFGLNDHDPYQAITVPARPLKVGNPLIADTPQLPLEDWPVSRLINYSIVPTFEFVLPHRHDDSFSIVADSR